MVQNSPLGSLSSILSASLVTTGILVFGSSQAMCAPKAYQFNRESLSAPTLAAGLGSLNQELTLPELEDIKKKIEREKALSDSEVQVSDAWLRLLAEHKAALLHLSDAGDLEKRLASKRKALDAIDEQAREEYAKLAREGVFAVKVQDPAVSGIGRRQLLERAQTALGPDAIGSIRGTFLSSSTLVENGLLKEDRIRTETSGEMDIAEDWLSETDLEKKTFLYLTKVRVRPLADGGARSVATPSKGTVSIVVDLSRGIQEEALLARGLNHDEIRSLREALPSGYDAVVGRSWVESDKLVAAIETNRREANRRLVGEIGQLERQLSAYRQQLKRSLLWLGRKDVGWDNSRTRLETSALFSQALEAVDGAILQERARKVAAKEKEPVAVWKRMVISENQPADDVAGAVIGILGQIQQQHGNVQRFLQKSESVNNMLVSDGEMAWQDWIRKVDRFDVFLVPKKDIRLVSVVAYFSLRGNEALPRLAPRSFSTPIRLDSAAAVTDSVKIFPFPTVVHDTVVSVRTVTLAPEPVHVGPSPMPEVPQESSAGTCRACWLAGGLAVGAGATATILLLTGNDGSTKSTAQDAGSQSSKTSVEATW